MLFCVSSEVAGSNITLPATLLLTFALDWISLNQIVYRRGACMERRLKICAAPDEGLPLKFRGGAPFFT